MPSEHGDHRDYFTSPKIAKAQVMPLDLETSGPESSGLEKLRNGIEDLRCKAVYGHYFDPKSIKELCKPELVKAAVHDCSFPAHKEAAIAQAIIRNGVLTFCILVHINREHLMVTLLERDVSKQLDNRLPMDSNALDNFMQREESRRFYEVQWQFIPVILPKGEYLQIDEDYILPYLENKRHGDRDGSFGDIYKVTVERSMQDMFESPKLSKQRGEIVVIRKQIRFNENIDGFARERKCLETLQQLKHPNIVELLCSYTYRGEHSLIFPCEDMDLNDFLKCTKRYQDFQFNHTFYLAIYGLVSAVEYLHSFRTDGKEDFSTIIGYHHDIRPHNILVRSNTFILADFGLAKMNEGGKSSTSMKGGAGEYMAPECIRPGHIGRAADIWSLGGVFLDIAAYIEEGPDGRKKAQDQREGDGPYLDATTTHFFTNGNLKTGVIDLIERLQEDPKDKTIRTLLLLSRGMLHVEQESRPNAHTVRRNAAYIAIKSLFRGTLQGMMRWRERVGEMDAGRTWEDTWKLWAWGEEVGINGVNLATEKFKEAVPQADKNEKHLQKILKELVRTLGDERLLEEKSPARRDSDGASAPGQHYSVGAQRVNEAIRNLRTALPDDYGKRIKALKAYYGKYANHDPPQLPDMPDEPLQSPQHHEIADVMQSASSSPMKQAQADAVPSGCLEDLKIGSPLPRTPLMPLSNEKWTATPMSNKTESDFSKPRSSTFSPLNPLVKSTGATSIKPRSLVDMDIERMQKKEASSSSFLPHLRLPSPAIDGRWPERGSILERTGILADVTYETATRKRETKRFETHVLRSEDPNEAFLEIYCISDRINVSLCHSHEVSESASAYPHTNYLVDNKSPLPKVHFLGTQIVYEQTDSLVPTPKTADDEHLLAPAKARIESSDMSYTFTSLDDCRKFRSAVWGRDLLECFWAREISWQSVEKVESESISLWKEQSAPGKLSVSFRAKLKGAQEWTVVPLALANIDPIGRQEDKNLHLHIEPPRDASKAAKSKKSVPHQKLTIKFRSREDCNAARLRIDKARPRVQPITQD